MLTSRGERAWAPNRLVLRILVSGAAILNMQWPIFVGLHSCVKCNGQQDSMTLGTAVTSLGYRTSWSKDLLQQFVSLFCCKNESVVMLHALHMQSPSVLLRDRNK